MSEKEIKKEPKDKSRQWYFYEGVYAGQTHNLVRLDEPYAMKELKRELLAEFIKEEKEYRKKEKKRVWRSIRA